MSVTGEVEPSPDTTRTHTRTEKAARVVSHVVAEAPFLVAALVQMARGWRPTQDDAVIAIRSWAVLTARSPLVGQITQATGCGGHVAFSPGPILYWMLALPVRADSAHGVLWGAAIFAAAGMAIGVEAAWAVRGATGAIAVASFSLVLAATQVPVFVNPMWNPYFGVVWFASACAVSWAVASGRLRWWPWLVVVGSVAAETHLEYTVPCVALVVLAPVIGVLNTRARPLSFRWLVLGAAVGVACWAVPVAQEIGGNPGNMSVLLRCVADKHTLGWRFGLESLAVGVAPPPIWLHNLSSGVHGLKFLESRPAALGLSTLVGLAAVALAAWVTRMRDLAALSAVALVAAGSVAWALAQEPSDRVLELTYIKVVLWPVGMLVWAVVALGVREALGAYLEARRAHTAGSPEGAGDTEERAPASERARTSRGGSRPRKAFGRLNTARAGSVCLLSAVAVVFVGGVADGTVLASRVWPDAVAAAGGAGAFRGVVSGANTAERLVPRGPMMLFVSAQDATASYALEYGIIWVLISRQRLATAPEPFREPIDPPAEAVEGEAGVGLKIDADGSVSIANLSRT